MLEFSLPSDAPGYRMIDTIEIKNFRGFQNLIVKDCKRINVLVGESGSGKTALLEALYLAMGTTTELSIRIRQQRGLEGMFNGGVRQIERALWGDLFHGLDMDRTISIALNGTGEECRSLFIGRGDTPSVANLSLEGTQSNSSQMRFTWFDWRGGEHSVQPEIGAGGIKFPSTGEVLPDHYFFFANLVPSANETAGRFSELSSVGSDEEFVAIFREQYPWIENISVEALGGSPVLTARLTGTKLKLPVASLSSAINRYMSIFLAIQSRKKSAVLVDEIENGVYHENHASLSKALISFARRYETQIFASTHSAEWLKAFIHAAGDDTSDIALWKLERTQQGPELFQFSGAKMKAALEQGAELRGHTFYG